MKGYSQLNLDDRIRIETLLHEGRKPDYIDKKIGRSRGTSRKEINRNSVRGKYDAHKADVKANQRKYGKKKEIKKIRANSSLEYVVRKYLLRGKSPEKVARRIRHEYRIQLSGSTVRRYIDSKFARDLKMQLKDMKLLRKYKKRNTGKGRGKIPHRVDIDSRPLFISNPMTIGHYECDFIESVKGDRTVFMTLVDKFSRHKIAVKLNHKEARLVEQELKKIIKIHGIKSITFDNDLSFARHYKLGVFTYFSHPYHAREKGQIENANRGWRRFFPKKTELKNIPLTELDLATNYLNHDPMECLGRRTPHEVHYRVDIRYLPIMLY